MNYSTMIFTTSEANSTTPTDIPSIPDLCVYCIHFLFGVPTHLYILWLIVTKSGSGLASEFLNLNLSVCEIMYCLNSLFSVTWSDYFPSLSKLQPLTWFLLGLGITGRPLFQCLMCVERYLAVVHPVTFLKYKPLRYRVICSAVAWTITLCSCFCFMFRLVSFSHHVYICFYSIQFLLFLSIQLFCCLAVLRALKQSGPGERRRERKEENHMKRKAFHLILITTVSMATIYLPFTITGLSFILTQKYCSELSTAVFFCFVVVSFVQPVVYLHRSGKLSCACFP